MHTLNRSYCRKESEVREAMDSGVFGLDRLAVFLGAKTWRSIALRRDGALFGLGVTTAYLP
jgi:hypothetical protein